jgi:hypothetical protein
MMLDTAIFTLKTDRPVEESAEKLRGYFGTRFPEYPLLHQHVDGGYLYTYPKIQYKIIEGTPYILGIEEGVKILKEISDAIKKIELNGYKYKVAGQLNDTVPKSSDFDKHHICIFYGFTPMLF